MPKRLLRVVIASLVGMLLPALLAPHAARGETQATLPLLVFNRPPYYIVRDGRPAGGFLLEAALTVLQQAGISVRVRETPPSRILAALRATEADACAVGWVRIPEREAFAWFSLPLYHNLPLGVAVGGPRQTAAESLRLADMGAKGWNWGLRLGFSYGPVLDAALAAIPDQRAHRFSDTAHMLRLLAKGRLDAVLIEPEEFAWILDQEPVLAAQVRLLPLDDAPPGPSRHIMCGPAVPQALRDRIDAAIAAAGKARAPVGKAGQSPAQ